MTKEPERGSYRGYPDIDINLFALPPDGTAVDYEVCRNALENLHAHIDATKGQCLGYQANQRLDYADLAGLLKNLKDALVEYSPSDREQAGVPIEQLVEVMQEKHDIDVGILHGHAWTADPHLPADERMNQLASTLNYVLGDLDRKERFQDQVLALAMAFALAGSRDEAIAIRDDVRFFADIRAAIIKLNKEGEPGRGDKGGSVEVDTAIAQLVSEAVAADEVIDVYAAAGIDRPELSILDDEFLDKLAKGPRPNLQMELLRRLLADKIKSMRRTNLVESRRFSEMPDEAIARYTNKALTTAQIISELVELAKRMSQGSERAAELGLNDAEVAFSDAVAQNDAAVLELGNEVLKAIARDLVATIRSSTTIDWSLKESVRASIRAKVHRLLAKYDYPPDREGRVIQLVLEQAELLAAGVASVD